MSASRPLQNRMTPRGEIVAIPQRGLFMGNRGGALHDAHRRLGAARWRSKAWITCLLAFKGRRRAVMAPGRYTELFFFDEAVALAAGHRPCAECRREAFHAFAQAWRAAQSLESMPRAAEIDGALHAERIGPGLRAQRRHEAPLDTLPDGVFIQLPEDPDLPCLVLGGCLHPWTEEGYAEPRPRPGDRNVTVLTPRPIVAALRHGYRPVLHPSLARDRQERG